MPLEVVAHRAVRPGWQRSHAVSERIDLLAFAGGKQQNALALQGANELTCFEVRPPCPKCGMNMLKIRAQFECLRCGHVEKLAPKAAT